MATSPNMELKFFVESTQTRKSSSEKKIAEARLLFTRSNHPCHTNADIDLALWGVDVLQAETIAADLDELPLPYRFDVKAFEAIKQVSLREHIERKGIDWKKPPLDYP